MAVMRLSKRLQVRLQKKLLVVLLRMVKFGA